MTVRSRMSSIMGVIGPEQLKLFALEFEKLLYFTLFKLASTSTYQLVPNLVTLRSRMSSIMGLIRPEQLELFALELESSLE